MILKYIKKNTILRLFFIQTIGKSDQCIDDIWIKFLKAKFSE